jgi:hypothetical protein
MASSLSSTGGKLGLASKAQTLGSCHDAENSDGCCLAGVDDRLEALAHSVSQDVIPGLERELNKVINGAKRNRVFGEGTGNLSSFYLLM